MDELRVVFVNGLDELVTKEVLLGAFAVFGEVISVEIPIDATTLAPRGFGFVEFMDANDAKDAIDNMHESELFGRTIRVKLSNKRPAHQLKDPKKALWANQGYHRGVSNLPLAENEG
jgi:peptidyl-prolyl isomerase E (cyclophilin E)